MGKENKRNTIQNQNSTRRWHQAEKVLNQSNNGQYNEEEKEEQNNNNTAGNKEIVLKVNVHCEGCKAKVYKCLKGFEGIEDVVVDGENHKVVAKGKGADPLKVLERVRHKYNKNAQLISPKPKNEYKGNHDSGKQEQEKKEEVIVVVLKMNMHCPGCANDIKKGLERMKGVEMVEPNMENSTVTVKGVIDPPIVVEYAKKRLGKHAEIVEEKMNQQLVLENKRPQQEENIKEIVIYYFHYTDPQYSVQHIYPIQTFSDENPFSCSIM